MLIIRKYKRLDWFDFLERIDNELVHLPDKKMYFDLLDEIRMRRLECVSEGGVYKLKAPAKDIFKKFEDRSSLDQDFCNAQDLEEMRNLLNDIL